MSIEDVIATIDEEISKLQHARELLAKSPDVLPMEKRRGRPALSKSETSVPARRRGRPAGSKSKLAVLPKNGPARRTLSAEGKARIVAAQKARWAAARAAKKAAAAA